jgi:nitrogen fixation/metabolism regulation signal transduction histidine kinase
MVTLLVLTYLLSKPGYYANSLIVFSLLIFQCVSVYKYVEKTNTELARFLSAAHHADFTQRFDLKELGAGFGELGVEFSNILQKFQTNRTNQAEELIHLKAIIEHVPVPLISMHSQGKITLWNNSSRRLFGSNPVNLLSDLNQFGEDFSLNLGAIKAGERRLVTFEIDGMEQQLSISATQIIIDKKQEKIVSMQNIKNELDVAQLQAWQDLVRVLTHEIMNSITPVASLAKTAVDLLTDVESKLTEADVSEELSDVSAAVQTVARRSDGLMKFVARYKQLTHLPPPNKQQIKVKDIFEQVSSITTQHWSDKGITFNIHIAPTELALNIDIDMIEHMLINLLKNAEQALEGVSNPEVTLSAFMNKRGHVVIDIIDNGVGITDEVASKIFVPFFTTKHEGSGVGLALTRQVMIAHGGTVKLESNVEKGAVFRLTF